VGGIPDIPTGTGTGAGDLDDVFGKSLGDYDGAMEGEREVIASSGGGSAKSAEQRERGDAKAVSNGAANGNSGYGTMPGEAGSGGSGGGMEGGSAGVGNSAGDGGEGTIGAEPNREGGDYDESDDQQAVVVLPEDIPVDGSGDDVVGRQIREAAIAMQDVDPKAAEALWDEYRKHTGIK
jgi:hypothetical protein